MSFTLQDLERVADQQVNIMGAGGSEASLEWLRAREIELDAVRSVCRSAWKRFVVQAMSGDNAEDIFYDVVGQTFRLGWEGALASRERGE